MQTDKSMDFNNQDTMISPNRGSRRQSLKKAADGTMQFFRGGLTKMKRKESDKDRTTKKGKIKQ